MASEKVYATFEVTLRDKEYYGESKKGSARLEFSADKIIFETALDAQAIFQGLLTTALNEFDESGKESEGNDELRTV